MEDQVHWICFVVSCNSRSVQVLQQPPLQQVSTQALDCQPTRGRCPVLAAADRSACCLLSCSSQADPLPAGPEGHIRSASYHHVAVHTLQGLVPVGRARQQQNSNCVQLLLSQIVPTDML
jgi:hypothetical protein